MPSNLLKQLLADHPIVITGTGVVSAGGNSPDALWTALCAGRGTAGWREFDIAGERRRVAVSAVADWDRSDPDLKKMRRRDRAVQLAWKAATQAVRNAGLWDDPEIQSAGLIVGSSRGPISRLNEAFTRVDSPRYPPTFTADCSFASLSGALALEMKIQGPSCTVSATCASAAYAIAHAAEQLLLGKADIMVVGGTDAPLHRATIAQMDAAGVLGSHEDPQRTCRPFDVTRNGLVLGEGAAFLVLETSRSAEKRGVTPLARLSGWNTCLDHAGRAGVSEQGDGMVSAANGALSMSGLSAGQIDHVNAHGTGTRLNEHAEARALCTLFGDKVKTLPCVSTKPVTGHCLGATPALEAAICVETIQRQQIPPSVNCVEQDPDCPIHLHHGSTLTAPLVHVMSNSLGFWGYHASVIYSKFGS